MRLSNFCLVFFFCILTNQGPCSTSQSPTHLTDPQAIFGELWRHVSHLQDNHQFELFIEKRHSEIQAIKEHWKKNLDGELDTPFQKEVQSLIESGNLTRAFSGRGSAYLLSGKNGEIAFVLKPFDEDIFCLNNSKGFASPFRDKTFRVRRTIPLYRSMQAEVLSYQFACILDLHHLVPETHLGIVTHKSFFNLSDQLHLDKVKPIPTDHEKLCSIQRYIPHCNTLHSCIKSWVENQWTEQNLLDTLELETIESLFLLIWLLYDTDAHADNFAVIQREDQTSYLVKIDNGLTFPDRNENLLNILKDFPHARFPISEALIDKILNLPIDELIEAMKQMEMDAAIEAFLERVNALCELVKTPARTLAEIDLQMRALGLPARTEIEWNS